jgi:DNA-binding transcriptional regulator/RsmH inhibitor MraZ
MQTSVDTAGRLNTPKDAQEYFGANGVDEFFCTTFDGRIGLIYPLLVWQEHIAKMAATPGKAAAAKRLALLGDAHGSEVKADKLGRILLPSNLRAKIELGKEVYLRFYGGHAKLMTKAVRDAEIAAAEAHLASDLADLEDEGLY